MKLDVVLTNEAAENIRAALAWYSQQSTSAAEQWYDSLHRELAALAEYPERHVHAPENERVPIELRERNFGSGRRTTHRILFTIRPQTVVVYAVRHVAQQDWRLEESQDYRRSLLRRHLYRFSDTRNLTPTSLTPDQSSPPPFPATPAPS